MKWVRNILIGTTILGAGSALPIIPVDTVWVKAYQYRVDDAGIPEVVGSTTPEVLLRPYKDTDGDNVISVAVFRKRDGTLVEEQISDQRYAAMGTVDGKVHNPKKQELVPVADVFVGKAEAAIAFDAASSDSTNSVTSETFAHTTSSGSDRVLLVFPEANSASASETVTGVTYNGVAMTEVYVYTETVELGVKYYAFSLIAPSTGTNNVVVSYSGTVNNVVTAASYTGANQTTATGAENGNYAITTTPTASITTTVDGSYLVGGVVTNNRNPAVNGMTERVEILGANFHYNNLADESVPTIAAGSVDWTNAGTAQPWIVVVVELLAATAATVDNGDTIIFE